MKKLAFLAATVIALVTGRTFGGTFSDNFSTGLNPTYWNIDNSDLNAYTVSDPGGNSGVGIANTGGLPSGPPQGVSIVLNLAALGGNISGDFSAQIDFSNFAAAGPGDEAVSLDTNFSNGQIWDVIRDQGRGDVHVWEGFIPGGFASTADSGTFSITQTGGDLIGYFDGTEVSAIAETSPLSFLAFSLSSQGSDSTDTSAVTFSDFSITASSLPVPEPKSVDVLTLVAMGILTRCRRRTTV